MLYCFLDIRCTLHIDMTQLIPSTPWFPPAASAWPSTLRSSCVCCTDWGQTWLRRGRSSLVQSPRRCQENQWRKPERVNLSHSTWVSYVLFIWYEQSHVGNIGFDTDRDRSFKWNFTFLHWKYYHCWFAGDAAKSCSPQFRYCNIGLFVMLEYQ